jgi:hypothetical protein
MGPYCRFFRTLTRGSTVRFHHEPFPFSFFFWLQSAFFTSNIDNAIAIAEDIRANVGRPDWLHAAWKSQTGLGEWPSVDMGTAAFLILFALPGAVFFGLRISSARIKSHSFRSLFYMSLLRCRPTSWLLSSTSKNLV